MRAETYEQQSDSWQSGPPRANGKDTATTNTPSATWPVPLAPAALKGTAGEFVSAIEPHTEADPMALLVQFLLGFGNLIGRCAHFRVEDDCHYANEFAVFVGASAKARKGTSESRVRSALAQCDPDWASLRILGGLSSGEGLIWAVRDPIIRREPIREKGRVVDYQEVEVDPGIADKRLHVFEPEFASVLRQLEREGNILSAVACQAWDTGNTRTMTKNSPAVATGAHISIIGHITDDELRRYLSATEQGNGFANRFLWFCVRRSKFLPDGGDRRKCEEALAPVITKLKSAAQFSRDVGEMGRDETAKEYWRAIYRELSSGKPGLLGAVTSRAEAHVTRLSCIYALLDSSATVKGEHLEAAVATGSSTYNLAYAYDRFGNMTCQQNQQTQGLCPQYGFNGGTNQINNSGFSYDASGDMLSDNAHTYQYDAEHRLISVDNGSTATYVYNALGERVEKSAGGAYTEYVFGQTRQPMGEYNRTAWTDSWVTFEGRHFAHFSNGDTYFVHADRIGTTNIVTDWNTGTVIQDELHYPWGQVWTSAGSSIEERFAGLQHRDGESNLDPTEYRMFSSDAGRWTTPDPAPNCPFHPENFDRYNYAANNPTNRTDPLGDYVYYPFQQYGIGDEELGYDEFDLIQFGIFPNYPGDFNGNGFSPSGSGCNEWAQFNCSKCKGACYLGYSLLMALNVSTIRYPGSIGFYVRYLEAQQYLASCLNQCARTPACSMCGSFGVP